jgi:hypothetical protein
MRRIKKVKRAYRYRILTKLPIHKKKVLYTYRYAILTKEEKVIAYTVLYPDFTDLILLDSKAVKTDIHDKIKNDLQPVLRIRIRKFMDPWDSLVRGTDPDTSPSIKKKWKKTLDFLLY